MGLGAYPSNLPTTISKLMKISDDIWYIAGDRSIDVNNYPLLDCSLTGIVKEVFC